MASLRAEGIAKGDRILVWFGGKRCAVTVERVTSGVLTRSFRVMHDGSSFELIVERAMSIELAK